jgi:predicted Zn-dependent protease
VGRDDYLERVDKLTFGDSPKEGVRRGSSFYHRDLDFAVDFPAGWRLENAPSAVSALAPSNDMLIQLTMEDLNKRVTPKEFLRDHVKANQLRDEHPLSGTTLPGHAAVVRLTGKDGARDAHVAVVFKNNRVFEFLGMTKDPATLSKAEAPFLAAASSVRPLNDKERQFARGLHIRTIKARAGDTFAALAKRSPVSDYAELNLRLINDKFPDGEPTPGTTIKIVE